MGFDRVFGCEDTARLVLDRLCQDYHGVTTLRHVRATCRLLQHAIDRWIVSRLVIDFQKEEALDLNRLAGRFPSVKEIVLRNLSEQCVSVGPIVHEVMQLWVHLRCVEFDECEFGDDWLDDRDSERESVAPAPLPARHSASSSGVEEVIFLQCRFPCAECVPQILGVFRSSHVLANLSLVEPEFANERPQLPDFRTASHGEAYNLLQSVSFQNAVHLSLNDRSVLGEGKSIQTPLFSTPSSLLFYQERIEKLDLSGNLLCLDNVRLLFYEEKFHKLKKLRLRDCGLHESHAEIMSFSSSLVSLSHLDLSGNQLGTQVAMYFISASEQLTRQLEYLNLSDQAEFQEDAMYGWTMSIRSFESLTTLKLQRARVNAAGMHALAQPHKMPRIQYISFKDTYIAANALLLLGSSQLFSSQIRRLDFSGSAHGVEIRRLASAFCSVQSETLEEVKVRHSGLTSRRSKSADRSALKALERFHGKRMKVVIVE